MIGLARQREHLALTDRHIAEVETRMATQKLLVARMSAFGQGPVLAGDLLRTLEDDLRRMREDRENTLRAIARLASQ